MRRLPAYRREGGATLGGFPRDALRSQAPGCLLGLLEHVSCAREVLGALAGDQRAGPACVGAGEEQRRTEPPLDLSGGGKVAVGVLIALKLAKTLSTGECPKSAYLTFWSSQLDDVTPFEMVRY